MPLTAKEARKLSEQNSNIDIEVFVSHIDSRISDACKKGKDSIDYPFYGLKGLPSYKQIKKIKQHYIDSGFKWIYHPDPDPGHPCSTDYEEIKW